VYEEKRLFTTKSIRTVSVNREKYDEKLTMTINRPIKSVNYRSMWEKGRPYNTTSTRQLL